MGTNLITVQRETETKIAPILIDLSLWLNCTTYHQKNFTVINDLGLANYWIGKGNLPINEPLYRLTCRGHAKPGDDYLDKAYHFEVAPLFGEPISDDLEGKIRDRIRNAPA